MLFKDITVIGADGRCRSHRFIGVRGSQIVYDGDTMPTEDFGEHIDGRDRALVPGLVNSHTHVPMTLMRSYGENMPLQSWLFDRIFPFEDKLTGEAVYWGSLLGIAEMLCSGTTSFSDSYFFSMDLARAVTESGIKANISRSFACNDTSKHLWDIPGGQQAEELLRTMHGAADGRLLVDVSPHAEYTVHAGMLAEAAELADRYGARVQMHISETQSEHRECIGRHGLTPTGLLKKTGLLSDRLTVAHGVWLSDDDMDLLADAKATVAHCPKSNLKLGSGIASVDKLFRRGVSVALGTDSAASNNVLDMVDEMKFASLLAKGVSCDPCKLPTGQVLTMATRAGALAQGRQDTGDIVVGMRADLVMLRTDIETMTPGHDVLSDWLYSAGRDAVCMTVVDGRILFRDGEWTTLDMEKVKSETKRCVENMLKL